MARWILLGLGLLLVAAALFLDPVGADPDSGVIALGRTPAKVLVGALGGIFLLAFFLRSKDRQAPS